jgi:hypothetical protein
MELPFRKVICGNRVAVTGALTSDFTIELPSMLQLPADTACYVLDLAVGYGFYSVEAGTNDQLHILERYWNGSQDITEIKQATLSPGSYTPVTLAAEIQNALAAVSIFLASYTCGYESATNTILISLSYNGSAFPAYANFHGFTILSAAVLADPGVQTRVIAAQPTFNFANLRDASGLISIKASSAYSTIAALLQAWDNPSLQGSFPITLRTGHIDIRSSHVLYLHSDALAGMRTIGPSGSRSVVARIPVTTTFGGMLFKEHSSHAMDYIPVGGRNLMTLDFSIRDSFGALVNLHGSHVSLELLFVPEPVG